MGTILNPDSTLDKDGQLGEQHSEEEKDIKDIELKSRISEEEHLLGAHSNQGFRREQWNGTKETDSFPTTGREDLGKAPDSEDNPHLVSSDLKINEDIERDTTDVPQGDHDESNERNHGLEQHKGIWGTRDTSTSSMTTEDRLPPLKQPRESSSESRTMNMPKKNLTLMRKLEKLKVSAKRGRPKKTSSKKKD